MYQVRKKNLAHIVAIYGRGQDHPRTSPSIMQAQNWRKTINIEEKL